MNKIYTLTIVQKRQLITACVLMALGVAIGAFGAHGLKEKLSSYSLEIYNKGVFYHFIHTLALFLVVVLSVLTQQNFKVNFWLFLAGILCFSGSLYLLAIQDLVTFSLSWAGPITPLGGSFFIAGWVSLLLKIRNL